MAENLESINIDINMRQNVSEESERASRGMDNVTSASKTLKEQIELQQNVLAGLEKQYAQAKGAFDKVNIGTNDANIIAQREQASKLFKEVRAELNAEKQGLAELEKELGKINQAQDKASNSSTTYMTQIRRIKQEMQELTMTGKGESMRYRELQGELEKTGTAYRKVHQEQRLLTTAGSEFEGLMRGIQGVAGVFAAGQGAASLFVKDSEQLAAIQTKLQAAISITIGLQQVSNTLHETSAFRINTVTKVTNMWRNAQMTLNTQLGISTALSKALMVSGIGLLLVGIAALVYKYQEWNKQQEETARLNKIVTDGIKTAALEGEKAAKKETVSLKLLYDASQNDKKSKEERLRAVREIQKLYPDYFGSLSTEEVLAGKGAEAYNRLATSILAAAKARAAADKITENESKILDLEAKKAEAEAKKLETENKLKVVDTKNSYKQAANDPYAEGAMLMLADAANASALKTEIREYSQEISNATKEIEKYGEVNQKLADKINVGDLLYESKGGNKNYKPPKPENNAEKLKKQQEKANEDLEKKTVEYQNKIAAARIAAMAEGAEKVKAEIKAEYEKEKALIAQELKEIGELEAITGKPATKQRAKLETYSIAIDNKYLAENEMLAKESAKQVEAIFDEVNQRFRSELDNNLSAINNYYDAAISEAKAAGAAREQIDVLDAARKRELAGAENQNQLKILGFETEIAARRMALAQEFFFFETDRLKKELEMKKKAKEEELKLLQEQYKQTPTTDLANDIVEATVEVEEFESGIKKLSGAKFQEVSQYITQISSGLSDLFGADSSAGKALGWMGDFSDAGAKIASGNPKAMIEGTLQAAGTIKDIIKTNQQANKEIREFAYQLEQAAITYSIAVINAIKDLKSTSDSIFYTDTSNALTQGMAGYNAAIEKETNLVEKLGDTTVEVGKKKKKFLGVTTGTKGVWEGVLTGYKKVLDTEDELIDKNGRIDKQIANSLLDSGKLSKEATNLIKQILDAQDAADAAMAQVESTLESLAGTIGDDLKSALVNAFQDGGALAAAEQFKQSVSKTLEGIVTDNMFSVIYGEMLGELSQRMKDSYDTGGDKNLVDDITWFYKQSQEGATQFYDQLEKAKEELAKEGIDLFSGSSREGASKGIATASQDSINELNGGVYAMRQSVNDIRNLEKESLAIQRTRQELLNKIADDVSISKEHLRLIKQGIEGLVNNGVKIKDR